MKISELKLEIASDGLVHYGYVIPGVGLVTHTATEKDFRNWMEGQEIEETHRKEYGFRSENILFNAMSTELPKPSVKRGRRKNEIK